MTRLSSRIGLLAGLTAILGLSACAMIDEDSQLDPEVMEDPWMDEARDNSTPQGVMGDNTREFPPDLRRKFALSGVRLRDALAGSSG